MASFKSLLRKKIWWGNFCIHRSIYSQYGMQLDCGSKRLVLIKCKSNYYGKDYVCDITSLNNIALVVIKNCKHNPYIVEEKTPIGNNNNNNNLDFVYLLVYWKKVNDTILLTC